MKNEDSNWQFPREALERVRPADTVAETAAPDADTSDADTAADDDVVVETIKIRSGTPQPEAVEVVSIRTAPPEPAPVAVEAAPGPTAVDERGISAATFALVFAALDGKKRISEIVQEHTLLPDDVEWIAAKWRHVNEIDLNSPAVPVVVAKLAKHFVALEARVAALGKCQNETVEAHNTLADRVEQAEPDGELVARLGKLEEDSADLKAQVLVEQANGGEVDVEHPTLAEQVVDLDGRVQEIADFLHQFVPGVVMRRDVGGIVRRKLLEQLPLAVQRMFAAAMPPGTCDYFES